MAKTTIHGWTLPDGTSRPVVHTDMKNLADQMDGQVPFVCTSTTRPAHSTGLIIFETDTKRTRRSNGTRWMVVHQPWRLYTPDLGGNWGLGSGSSVSGAYNISGDEWCNVQAKIVWGSGATAPQQFPYVSVGLPFAIGGGGEAADTVGVSSFIVQGIGAHLYDGFGGGIKNVVTTCGVGGTGFQVFSNPNGSDVMNSIAGLGFKQGTVMCLSMSYRAVIPD